jgi:4-amino-4-deoxy-L-arabinose transferase-like glycosyltransferase
MNRLKCAAALLVVLWRAAVACQAPVSSRPESPAPVLFRSFTARPGRSALALGAVLLVTHLPALVSPGTIQDEAVYVVVAREMLRGGRPYLDAIDRKPPLLFWVYRWILGLFGTHNWPALHLVGILWVLATMGALYLVGSRVAGPGAGFVAALLYAVFQTFWEVTNLAFNGEVLMNLPVVVGLWIALRPSRSRWRPELLLAGAMPALGFLLKQPAGIAGLPLGVYVLLPAYRRARGLNRVQSLVHGAWICLGFATVLGAAALVLHHQGILRDAFYWSVLDHDVPYGPSSPVFWARGGRMTLIFCLCAAPLLLGARWSLRRPDLWASREPERTALLVFLGATMIGTAASGRFFDYYYIQLLPPLALLAAPWFAWSWQEDVHPARARWMAAWVAACGLVFLVTNLVEMPDPLGQAAVSRYIRAHSVPGDRLFVWGQYTKFYLHADLRPATRYIAFFPLTGYIFGSPWNHDASREDTRSRIRPGAWDSLAADFTRHPPRYILDTEGIRHPPKYPMSAYPLLRNLVPREYRLVFTAPEGLLYARRTPAGGSATVAAAPRPGPPATPGARGSSSPRRRSDPGPRRSRGRSPGRRVPPGRAPIAARG